MGDEQHETGPYLIGELAELAGVTPRTIRYYTAEGLLPPPATRGKYASYGPEHLERLRQIAMLKGDYLPLAEIRRRLEAGGGVGQQGDVRPEASGAARLPTAGGAPGFGAAQGRPAAPPGGGSAGAYQQAGGPAMSIRESQDPFRLAPAQPQLGRIEFFPASAELSVGEGGTGRWQRIELAPGVELHIREPIPERRRRKLEAMIVGLRDALRRDEDEQ